LGRDQNASLIQGLAHKGTFDFRRYDPLDSYHKARLRLALNYEERQRFVEYQRDVLAYSLAVANTPGRLKHESRVRVQDRAFEALQSHYNLQFPWDRKKEAAGKSTTTDSEIKSLRDEWIRIWGDPNDPEVKAKIQRTADSLMKGTRAKALRDAQLRQTAGP